MQSMYFLNWSLDGCKTSLLCSVALTLFYKKHFTLSSLPVLICLLITSLFLAGRISASALLVSGIISFILIPFDGDNFVQLLSSIGIIKVFLYYFFIDDLLHGDHSNTLDLRYKVLFSGLVQFARYPRKLVKLLRPVRSTLGPVYVGYTLVLVKSEILSLGCEDFFYVCDTFVESMVKYMFFLQGCMALLAGTVFRPDNKALIGIFCPDVTFMYLKRRHRILMILSFIGFCSAWICNY